MNKKTQQRFKKRLPSVKGFVRFWRPTLCAMCYWWRLAVPLFVAECLALFGISVGWALVVGLFSVGLFYGFAPKNFIEDEKPDDGMAEVIAKNMGYGTLITQDENDA